MPLEISVVTGGTAPIYRQIVDQICRAVATGRLVAGEQMPSVRVLAEDLVLNPNTVARAYAELIREGVLEGHQGKGVYVGQRRSVFTKTERLRRLNGSLETLVNDAIHLGFSAEELQDALARKLREMMVPHE